MSIYDPDRIAHKLVRKHADGITVGFNKIIPVSWQELLDLEPAYWRDTVSVHGHKTVYAHLIYRVLAVHGVYCGANSKPSQRVRALNLLIARERKSHRKLEQFKDY